ncbi:MAG: hypothetical protein ACQ9ET_02670 [Nitrosomonadaceae bacterium]
MTFLGYDTTDTIFQNIEPNVDIPLNDEVAYKLYPKYNWVYSTSRLLDFQKVEWTPFSGGDFTQMHSEFPITGSGGAIYTRPMEGEVLTTDVVAMKGDIKWAKHHTLNEDGTKEVLDDLRGNVELRISALTTMHFQKFAGVISVDTIGNVIVAVRLCMTADVVDQYPEDWLKRVLRIYNRRPWGK